MKRLPLLLASAVLFSGASGAFAAEEAWLADFRRADLNDSGGLSKAELKKTASSQLLQIKNNFVAIDADHDGQVSADEYRRYLSKAQDDFAAKFKKADLNDSGGLSRRELEKLSGSEFGFIATNFDAMDADRDGQVSYAEFRDFQARMPAPAPAPAAASPVPGAPRDMCRVDCGVVVAIDRRKVKGDDGTMGAIAGGVVGGLLGNQVGKGTGKTVATVAGAAGGAYAGNQIQKQASSKRMVKVTVKFDNGSQRDFDFESDQSPYPKGARVQLRDGQLMQYSGQ